MRTKKDKKKETTLTVHLSLKGDLLEKIDQQAEQESRNRLNMITVLLQRALTVQETQQSVAVGSNA